jgi:hypothetical protein
VLEASRNKPLPTQRKAIAQISIRFTNDKKCDVGKNAVACFTDHYTEIRGQSKKI